MKLRVRVHRWALMAAVLGWGAGSLSAGVSYYVHPTRGDDANVGISPEQPLRTLARASDLRLRAGDRLLLAAGEKFFGSLRYDALSGTEASPVVIASYAAGRGADGSAAVIDARGLEAGVRLRNCSHFELRDLQITANGGGITPAPGAKPELRCGVLVLADQPGEYRGFNLTNLTVKDVFFEAPGFVRGAEEVRTANGTQSYGWGIRFLNITADAVLKDITIRDCRIDNLSHTGLKLTAPSNGLQNVVVQGVQIANTGGPGVQMSGVRGGHFSRLDVTGSGSTNDTRNWKRGSGLWTWGSSDIIIEKSRFTNASGPGDSAGVHIDFNCRNVIVQYNFSANNAGGFCEILGNNHNCAYRYNVSVNDGHRVKGVNGAFQEGKTFWLSGYTGDKSPRQGPFNSYFYNNTVYVNEDMVAKFAVGPTARGVLIANNIFYIRGHSASVVGDQNRADSGKAAALPNVVFQNNLFLRADNWPGDSVLQDQTPFIGDPEFANGGGWRLEDYVPRNASLVRNRGMVIPRLPQDEVGLLPGLQVERDILGEQIVGLPDLGAIEVPPSPAAQASR